MHSPNKLKDISLHTLFPLFMVGYALVLASLIVAENYRYAFVFIVVPTFVIVFQRHLHRKNVVILLGIAAFFPIPLNVSTTNLGPTSQYLILFSFAVFLIGYLIGKTQVVFTRSLVPLLSILFIVAAISTASTWGNHVVFRTSFWSLIMLLSCGCFLLFLDSLEFDSFEEKKHFFLQFMDLIIGLLCLQIVIGAIVYYLPQTGEYFSIFYSANKTDYLAATVTDVNITRLRTVVFTVEGLGEIIAMLLPYVLYRFSSKKSFLFMLYSIIIGSGLMLSVNRSGIILSSAAVLIYLLLIEKSAKMKFTIIATIILAALVVISFDLGLTSVIQRFSFAYDQYSAGGDPLSISNRSFFRENFGFFLERLSLFGNGLVSPLYYKVLTVDFHNLYLTIFFQYGVIGGILYFLLPVLLVRQIWQNLRSMRYEKLDKIMLLSMVLFFLNEFKFEFTRNLNGVLVVWIVFSLYFLFSKSDCVSHKTTIDPANI